MLKAITTLAAFVAKNGPQFEELARQRQAADPKFAFLFGGAGHVYYKWRVNQLREVAARQVGPDRAAVTLHQLMTKWRAACLPECFVKEL